MGRRDEYAADLPALSHHFGLKPWELDHLTGWEWDAYLDALAQIRADDGAS